VDAYRSHERAARAYGRRPIRRAAASARRNTNHAGLWRDLRDRVARARPGHDGRSDMIGERGWRLLAPVLIGALFLTLWEAVVRLRDIPPYILPAPSAVAMSLWNDGPSLLGSLLVTDRKSTRLNSSHLVISYA